MTTQVIIPHHSLKGMRFIDGATVKHDISLVIAIIIKKYGHVIDESPATKHRTSSGNIGSRNISDRIATPYLELPLTIVEIPITVVPIKAAPFPKIS